MTSNARTPLGRFNFGLSHCELMRRCLLHTCNVFCHWVQRHYCGIKGASWCLNSLATELFVQQFGYVQANNKGNIKALHLLLEISTGPWFNIKMSSYQYRKSHCGDKMVIRSSYLHNGISYTGKISSLYWIGALVTFGFFSHRASNEVQYIQKVLPIPRPAASELGLPVHMFPHPN